MKKLLSILLVFVMVLTLIPNTALANEEVVETPSASTEAAVSFPRYGRYDYRVDLRTYDVYGNRIYNVSYRIYDSNYRYYDTITDDRVYLPEGHYTIEAYDRNGKEISRERDIRVYKDKTVNLYEKDYYYGDLTIKDINVTKDKVSGRTEAYADVTLYRGGSYIGKTTANSNGYFSISHDFGYYRDYPYGREYRIYPDTNTSYRVSGKTTKNTPVVVVDEDGNYLGSTVSDRYGYYSISHNYVSRPKSKKVYADYYDSDYYYRDGYYYRYYDLSDYYLIAENSKRTSGRYYLEGRYLDYSYPKKDGKVTSPVITEALPGEVFVRGHGATPHATVTIRDFYGEELGSTKLGSDGKFAIRINRPLRSGETINITTSHDNFYADVITYKVAGVPGSDYNYKNKFIIGEKKYIQTVDGKETIKEMDTVPYVTNGRTMLPVRFVAESLDYTVTFDPATSNAVFISGTDSLVINLWSRDFYVNGMKHRLSVDPITVDGRIMLPVSELGRALGLTHGDIGEGKNIEWDQQNREVIIQIRR